MHSQLEAIAGEFEDAARRVHQLARAVSGERWWARPAPDRWSVGECIVHLNLTSTAFRPLVERALDDARRLPREEGTRRHGRGLLGGLLWRVLGQKGRFRVKTTAPFVPSATGSPESTLEEFDRLQAQQTEWLRAADGLPLTQVRIVSPFGGRLRYNLFAAFSILAQHQQRHVWQAERAAEDLELTRPA